MLVFDVTSAESFNALPSWLKEVEQNASPKVISVLVGESRKGPSQLLPWIQVLPGLPVFVLSCFVFFTRNGLKH